MYFFIRRIWEIVKINVINNSIQSVNDFVIAFPMCLKLNVEDNTGGQKLQDTSLEEQITR